MPDLKRSLPGKEFETFFESFRGTRNAQTALEVRKYFELHWNDPPDHLDHPGPSRQGGPVLGDILGQFANPDHYPFFQEAIPQLTLLNLLKDLSTARALAAIAGYYSAKKGTTEHKVGTALLSALVHSSGMLSGQLRLSKDPAASHSNYIAAILADYAANGLLRHLRHIPKKDRTPPSQDLIDMRTAAIIALGFFHDVSEDVISALRESAGRASQKGQPPQHVIHTRQIEDVFNGIGSDLDWKHSLSLLTKLPVGHYGQQPPSLNNDGHGQKRQTDYELALLESGDFPALVVKHADLRHNLKTLPAFAAKLGWVRYIEQLEEKAGLGLAISEMLDAKFNFTKRTAPFTELMLEDIREQYHFAASALENGKVPAEHCEYVSKHLGLDFLLPQKARSYASTF